MNRPHASLAKKLEQSHLQDCTTRSRMGEFMFASVISCSFHYNYQLVPSANDLYVLDE